MRMNKCAYLFAAALVASTVGMTSCSNEDVAGIENIQGQNAEVTIGLAVKGAGVNTKATGESMNFAGTADIKNVAIVPYADAAAQRPVCWETISATNGKDGVSQKAQLLSSVDLFKVYGNLTDDQYKNVNAGTFNLAANTFYLSNSTVAGHETYFAPHASLYYFKNADEFSTATAGDDWKNASYTDNQSSIVGAKYIKISDVNYAVGSLAVAVKNGALDEGFVEIGEGSTETPATAAEAIEISGIVVKGQKDFDLDFKTTGDEKAVYDVVDPDKTTFAENSITSKGDAAANGNLFVIVSPTGADQKVTVSIEFKVKDGYKFTNKQNESFTAGQNFYLSMQLSPATYTVFAADYLTKVNATVKNWGLATEEPVDVTDAELGVVFDVDWEEGNLYEVEI